jgi:hypothetical protein
VENVLKLRDVIFSFKLQELTLVDAAKMLVLTAPPVAMAMSDSEKWSLITSVGIFLLLVDI